jgi:hypothetical protein
MKETADSLIFESEEDALQYLCDTLGKPVKIAIIGQGYEHMVDRTRSAGSDDYVKIIPKNNASLRIKNKIREHGPLFKINRELPSVVCLQGKAGINVSSKEKTWKLKPGAERTYWGGWFPLDEIEIIEGV